MDPNKEHKFEDPSGKPLVPAKRAPEVIDVLHALLRPAPEVGRADLPKLLKPIEPYRPLGQTATETEVAVSPSE